MVWVKCTTDSGEASAINLDKVLLLQELNKNPGNETTLVCFVGEARAIVKESIEQLLEQVVHSPRH